MKRQELTDEQSRAAHLNIFKGFVCKKLEEFFEFKGEQFQDPDIERDIDESELSDFVYDLGEGFNAEVAQEQNFDYLDENIIEESEMKGLVEASGIAKQLSSEALTPRHTNNLAIHTTFDTRRRNS